MFKKKTYVVTIKYETELEEVIAPDETFTSKREARKRYEALCAAFNTAAKHHLNGIETYQIGFGILEDL